MNCPACRSPLEKFEFHNVVVDQCAGCSGVWLDHKEIDELLGHEELPQKLIGAELVQKPSQVVPEGHRTCPHCKAFLKLIEVDGTSLDVCSECKGVWADLGEFKALAEGCRKNVFEMKMLDGKRR